MTAQKRRERLQDVPITVTSVSGAKLSASGITDTAGLSQIVPGLSFGIAAIYLEPDIRGIQSSVNGLGSEANVAFYLDGVYQSSPTATLFQLADIDHVEVLKGPQGTLFGRNATGGAISVVTRTPSFTPTADFSLSYGRYNEVKGSGYVSGPLTDNLAASLSVYGGRDDGYYHDLNLNKSLGGDNVIATRAKLLWKPGPSTNVTLAGDYSYSSDNAGIVYTVFDGLSSVKGVDPNVLIASQPYTSALTFDPYIRLHNVGLTLNVQHDFDTVSLISVTGARRSLQSTKIDLDNTPVDFTDLITNTLAKSVSEDLRLQSANPNQRFSWTVGLYEFFDRESYDPFILTLPLYGLTSTQTGAATASAQAVYAQATYKIVPQLLLTAGLRYGIEYRTVSFSETGDLGNVPFTQAGQHYHDLSPKVTLMYKFDPSSSVFFTYSKGYKSGLYNPSGLTTQSAAPEDLYAYELGVKSDLSRHLRVNVSSFYYDYRHLQIQSFVGLSSQVEINNADSAKVYGADGDIYANFASVLAPDDTVELSGGFAYLHSAYGTYLGAVEYVPNPGGVGQTLLRVPANGNRLIEAPSWTLNATLKYQLKFGFGKVALNSNVYYNSGYYNDAANTPDIRQPSYVMINGGIDVSPDDSRFTYSIWVKNLTSAKLFSTPVSNTSGIGANYVRPVSYGVAVKYHL